MDTKIFIIVIQSIIIIALSITVGILASKKCPKNNNCHDKNDCHDCSIDFGNLSYDENHPNVLSLDKIKELYKSENNKKMKKFKPIDDSSTDNVLLTLEISKNPNSKIIISRSDLEKITEDEIVDNQNNPDKVDDMTIKDKDTEDLLNPDGDSPPKQTEKLYKFQRFGEVMKEYLNVFLKDYNEKCGGKDCTQNDKIQIFFSSMINYVKNECGNTPNIQSTTIDDKLKQFFNNIETDICQIVHNTNHYLALINSFVDHNKIFRKDWLLVRDFFQGILKGKVKFSGDTIKELLNNIIIDFPSINTIYNWLKSIIASQGGLGGILEHFQVRIKYDIIQSIVNPWRIPDKNTSTIKGSGHCTIFPLTWWQNCPSGTVPVGHRGWSSPKTKNDWACHKWYELLSGELLCQTSHISGKNLKELQKHALKVVKVVKKIDLATQAPTIKLLSKVISKILTLISLIPGAAPVVQTMTIIFKIIMIAMPPDKFSWLFRDIEDICFNVLIDSENNRTNFQKYYDGNMTIDDLMTVWEMCFTTDTNTKIVPDIGKNSVLKPGLSDNQIAHRSCDIGDESGIMCFTQPQATCIE